jgi:formylglycine-generating enzyme required for sulfatase activity
VDQLKATKRVCYDAVPGATGDRGPIMVVVPGGAGMGGSFAIGRNEVTVGNWNDYCKLSSLGGAECKPANGNPNDPVANVTAADVEKYAVWLTATTKVKYRLPSRAEWVYAATATGKNAGNPNCIVESAGRGKVVRTVDRDPGNDWGLRDALGNVQELVKTESGYEARGGHFNMPLGQCSVDKASPNDGRPEPITGFRLVRELGPSQ